MADVRPYAVGGIVRGLEFEDALLRSLVDLQEKLHLTVGRRRKKVAIGFHDMDKVTPPYTYKAVLPPEVRFTVSVSGPVVPVTLACGVIAFPQAGPPLVRSIPVPMIDAEATAPVAG